MGADAITDLLTIFLIIAVCILLVLITVFIILSLKNKKQERENKENEKNDQIANEVKKQFSTVQTKTYTTDSVKNFMSFKEIKDNMILLNDGKKYVMVIQCKGINYDLMSSIEKSGVEQGFSQFLNTLTRPIQIHVQARKVNLEESIERYKKRLQIIEANFYKAQMQLEQAQKRENMTPQKLKDIKMEYIRRKNIYEYTQDVIANTEKMSLNQNILTKNYYIVISYMPEDTGYLFDEEEIMEMAFSELYTNAQAILRTLSVCGVTGKILDSVELAELLYVAYNRDASELYGVDEAIEAGYDALYTTAPDVINKKIEQLDKLIDEKAFELANDVINRVELKNKREKELAQKEKNMEDLVKELAKAMILESEGYVPKEVINESIEEIEKTQTKKNKSKKGA